jgi:hypothetical protein
MKRWEYVDYAVWVLNASDGQALAVIQRNMLDWTIKIRNRNNGWTYSYSSSLPYAKRIAKAMIEREKAFS